MVSFGGTLASILRYLASYFIHARMPSAFPYGTFAVNILGCLPIGIVFGLSEKHDWLSPELRLFLAVAVCDGFTTFSAFPYENIILVEENDYPI